MNKNKQITWYVIADYFAAGFAWCLFFIFRKIYLEPLKYGHDVELEFNERFFYGLAFLPIVWIIFYVLLGIYRNPYRKSRLKEFSQTALQALIGVFIIFFALLLDDEIANYKSYYLSLVSLFILHFFFTALFRGIITTRTARKIHSRKIGFRTLIIGSNEKALELYNELKSQIISSGFDLTGFVHINGGDGHLMKEHLPHLGHVKNVVQIIDNNQIEEVIIAIESSEHESIRSIINEIQGREVYIKIIPSIYDILSGSVKMTAIFGVTLIDVTKEIMPQWQHSLKRIMDIVASISVLIFGFPFFLVISLIVKFTSKGSVIYSHERIGKNGTPFMIHKFRSMYQNAEQGIPLLSSEGDSRITPFGLFMRKTRIDEFPQFYNVLLGEMSIVGPRPERQYFINKIKEVAPHYGHLNKIKPGITSWGQVKYGYAENVKEMIERLKYDLLYVENRSLFLDFKIIIYTVLIVLQGRGK
ncbi:MAG: sugar transferase [Flavobacteriales bacterium]|nr:sugar transferase [Flavobacteriales bacterium]